MMARFGITGRLLLIGLVGFAGILVMSGTLIYLQRAQESAQQVFPVPEQIAAAVAAIDPATENERAAILRALNSASVSYEIDAKLPALDPGVRWLSRLEAQLLRLAPLAGKDIRVAVGKDEVPNTGPTRWISGVPVVLAVPLQDGNYLTVKTPGGYFPRLFGVPTGFWLAIVSLLIAVITLAALVREMRPIRRLTDALATFSNDATPVHVAPAGASDVRLLIETVNTMQQRMSTLLKGRTILVGAISHDLKTYLTRLSLRVEMLSDDAERNGAEADIQSMKAIIDNSLTFAQSAASGHAMEPVDLAGVIEEQLQAQREHGKTIAWTPPGEAIKVKGDRVALGRVVANLVDNAQRYADIVRVSLSEVGGEAIIEVDDNGPGIPLEEREAVFEPFYRIDQSRNFGTGGTGLGLALCRQIVEAHGGMIIIEASRLGGTRVVASLDLAPEPDL